MTERIRLLDPDRPAEMLEVDIIACEETVLRVGVPSTIVTFDLVRRDDSGPYRGSIGGRSFVFTPTAPRRSPRSETPGGARSNVGRRILQKI